MTGFDAAPDVKVSPAPTAARNAARAPARATRAAAAPPPQLTAPPLTIVNGSVHVQLNYGATGYVSRLIPELRLDHGQAEKLKALQHALIARGAKLADGRPVKSQSDAAVWLIEQLPTEGAES